MLAYRVVRWNPSVTQPEKSGHPEYLHRPQLAGRVDNTDYYDCWYFGLTPEAAVGESFACLPNWDENMFSVPSVPEETRSLVTVEIPDDINLVDLDDAQNLVNERLRPTQVVERRRAVTQEWALKIHGRRTANGLRWAGIRWWSYHRPHWTILALWTDKNAPAPFEVHRTAKLELTDPWVQSAAKSLGRDISI